jgi:hypothetical protein
VSQAKKKGETVKRKVLKLSEDKNGSAYIKELREIQVGEWRLPFSERNLLGLARATMLRIRDVYPGS